MRTALSAFLENMVMWTLLVDSVAHCLTAHMFRLIWTYTVCIWHLINAALEDFNLSSTAINAQQQCCNPRYHLKFKRDSLG